MSATNNTTSNDIARRRHENTQSGFLSLPAEIRNQIYGFVATPHYAKLSKRLKTDDTAEESRQNMMEYRRRQSLGLTQVCAQIHQEFLPLHLSSLHCSVEDMASYMSTFYPDGRGLCGSIHLIMSDLTDKLCDFLPVLRLKAMGSNILWHIRDHNSNNARDLKVSPDIRHILDSGVNKAWSDFLLHKVSKFEYCMGKDDSMKIVMKASAKEDWMPWDPKTDGKEEVPEKTRRAMARWKIFNGLGHLKTLPKIALEDE